MKMNPVVLELPDNKRTFIIDYCLKGAGWMAKVYFVNHFYALITMLSPGDKKRNYLCSGPQQF